MPRGWIGVDLDGTLAEYHGFQGPTVIGKPVPAMVERVKRWLAEGWEVRIFTARVSCSESEDPWPRERAKDAIRLWAAEHIGHCLRVTNVKDYEMVELWDDRAVQVEVNTGRPIGHSTRGLDAPLVINGG